MGRPTVLVVDDQVGVRKLLEAALGGDGYAVTTAGNGQEALDLLAAGAEPPSLALVDLRMPVLDGVRTLAALKERYPSLPVVMMTAVGDVDRDVEVLRLGAVETISKPFDLNEVRALVAGLLPGQTA
ncbi:MAG: response regulator [Bacillota bacterium]